MAERPTADQGQGGAGGDERDERGGSLQHREVDRGEAAA